MSARTAPPDSVVALCTAFLAMAYLLPNHAPPWMSFIQEALAAAALAGLSAAVLLRAPGGGLWRIPELIVLALLVAPCLQYSLGLIPFLQTAWLHALFLLGLLVALLAGAALERRAPSMALTLLASAMGAAAIGSVGLALSQWLLLQPGETTLWIYRIVAGRPGANLGQPNLLGTLIVLALLSTHWFWRSAKIGGPVAFAVAAYLLAGLALTESRTGLLNAMLVGGALLFWYRGPSMRQFQWPLLALAAWLVLALVSIAPLTQLLDLPVQAGLSAERAAVGVRPLAWRVLADAALQRPWLGYGWGQTFNAVVAVALDHPALHRPFLSAHNLPLDLVLWNGIPITLAVVGAAVVWLLQCARRAHDDGSRVLVLFVTVPVVHALLEYPLYYAYFLLPVGVAAGAVGQRLELRALWRAPAGLGAALWLAAVAAFAITVRDYLNVEQSYRDLLVEKARIRSTAPGQPPDVLVLTSLRDLIVFSRIEPHSGLTAGDLSWMEAVVRTHPGPASFDKLARALALNGHPDDAQRWVDRLCSVFAPAACSALAVEWAASAERQPPLRSVRWP